MKFGGGIFELQIFKLDLITKMYKLNYAMSIN